MNIFIATLLFIMSLVFSAYGHELDIIGECREKGYAKTSVWTADIKCEVLE